MDLWIRGGATGLVDGNRRWIINWMSPRCKRRPHTVLSPLCVHNIIAPLSFVAHSYFISSMYTWVGFFFVVIVNCTWQRICHIPLRLLQKDVWGVSSTNTFIPFKTDPQVYKTVLLIIWTNWTVFTMKRPRCKLTPVDARWIVRV